MKKILIIFMFLANYVNASEKNINTETAYLAGGCYWGLEELLRKLPGVINTKVGFSGGQLKNATYNEVCLLYTSPSPRDATLSRMPSSA